MNYSEEFLDFYSVGYRLSPGNTYYTREAFNKLPLIDSDVTILDIGCGNGAQTLQLCQIPGVDIFAVDNQDKYLIYLKERLNKSEFKRKVKVIKADMKDLPFREQQFDIIWSEASIYHIGFKNGLSQWKKFLKPNGFMVITDLTWLKNNPPSEIKNYWLERYNEIDTLENKIKTIESCGFQIIDTFCIDENSWINNYFFPIEQNITDFLKKYNDSQLALSIVKNFYLEFEIYKKYKEYYSYCFYLIQAK